MSKWHQQTWTSTPRNPFSQILVKKEIQPDFPYECFTALTVTKKGPRRWGNVRSVNMWLRGKKKKGEKYVGDVSALLWETALKWQRRREENTVKPL